MYFAHFEFAGGCVMNGVSCSLTLSQVSNSACFRHRRLNLKFCGSRTSLPLDVTRIGHVQISPSRLHATDPHRNINLMDLRIGIRLEIAAPQPAERTELDNAPAYRISPI